MLVKLLATTLAAAAGAIGSSVPASFHFKVDESTVTGCGTFKVNFTRGSPPYKLTAIPFNGDVFNWEGTTLPYHDTPYGGYVEVQLPYATVDRPNNKAVTEVIFVMSDANGFGTGGVSGVIKIQDSKDTGCVGPDNNNFYWSTTPEQIADFTSCGTVKFQWGPKYMSDQSRSPKGKVTMVGVVPNGLVWKPDDEPDYKDGSLQTTLNIAAGVQVAFAGYDERGSGGVVPPVAIKSGKSDCINSDSPTTTSQTPWEELTASAIKSNPNKDASSHGLSTGIKAGIGIAVAVFFAVLFVIAFLLWRRSRRPQARYGGPIDMIDSDDDEVEMTREVNDARTIPTPFLSPPQTDQYSQRLSGISSSSGGQGYGDSDVQPLLRSPSYLSSSAAPSSGPPAPSSGPRTVGVGALPVKGGAFPPAVEPKFVHHEDAGSAEPVADPDTGVIDVPPTYNPAWGGGSASASGSGAGP